MSLIAPTLQGFFTERLVRQRQVSPATVAAYRDSLRLLLAFASAHTGKAPSALGFDDLDAPTITAFLTHLEVERGNTARTRNARLAAIRALFGYAALCHPEHAATIARVLAIPQKRFDKAIVTFLTHDEAQALLHAPDPARWEGRRDQAILALAVQTGLRVSEITGLDCGHVTFGTGAHIACTGKGRKQRVVPLTTATATTSRPGLVNAAVSRSTRCSPPEPDGGSAATPSPAESTSMSPPPPRAVRRSPPNRSLRTCCVTPRPWRCSKPASTSP